MVWFLLNVIAGYINLCTLSATDWSYFEQFVRNTVKEFPDIYVVTGALYLPKLMSPKSSVVQEMNLPVSRQPRISPTNASQILNDASRWIVSYEMIGKEPSIGVPTHFYKIILAKRPKSGNLSGNVPSAPNAKFDENSEFAIGAFVLPNAPIPDNAPLESFRVPIDAVERAAGLSFFQAIDRAKCRDLCSATKCRPKPDNYRGQQIITQTSDATTETLPAPVPAPVSVAA